MKAKSFLYTGITFAAIACMHAPQAFSMTNSNDLADRVRADLRSDHDMRDYAKNVVVRTDGGTVTLYGSVEMAEQKKAILAKAASEEGVTSVVDKLDFRSDESSQY